jgi:hypothetical protein
MEDKVRVILRDGSVVPLRDWQLSYGLTGTQVGKYFSYTGDFKLRQDLEDYDQLIVCELLIRVLDAFRKMANEPVTINSFNRSEAKQERLREQGYKAAKYSPHMVYLAADINCTSEKQVRLYAELLRIVARDLEIKIRVGFQEYLKAGMTFVHVDVCPEYYAVGKPYHRKQHPSVWENSITW